MVFINIYYYSINDDTVTDNVDIIDDYKLCRIVCRTASRKFNK